MRHAYLIMAHNEPEILQRLIKILDRVENDIYVHIDKKSDINIFGLHNNMCKNAILHVIEHRLDVRWGDYSQVECELLLMRVAYAKGGYDYYHVISGVTLPIKSMQYIYDFFEKYNGKIFLGVDSGEFEKEAPRRIKYRIFFKDNHLSMLSHRTKQHLNGISFRLQKFFHCEKKSSKQLKIGSQWCSLTNEAVSLLLASSGWIKQTFQYGHCVDEIYKQTVIWNSPLRSKLYKIGNSLEGCMYEIDWSRGNGSSPYTFAEEADIKLLLKSDRLFARKFSSQHLDLVDKLIGSIHL